jgi:hypothetical protein
VDPLKQLALSRSDLHTIPAGIDGKGHQYRRNDDPRLSKQRSGSGDFSHVLLGAF